jgi:hypothetical protein
MNANWKVRLPLILAATVVVIALITLSRLQPAWAERENAQDSSGPRYSVIDTEGHNLIVTDNKTNTLYFYTVDRDKEVGADLKLRGTIDLNQVGKPVIKPTKPKAD